MEHQVAISVDLSSESDLAKVTKYVLFYIMETVVPLYNADFV
jgi:hypothetical protein